MQPQTKKKWIWTILIASGLMIVAYDLGMLIRNRLKPCQTELQDCPSRFYCSKASSEEKPRCLPLPSEPQEAFKSPLEKFECINGNLSNQAHSLDSSAFRLTLKALRSQSVFAAASGTAFFYPESKEVRIIHRDGYVSYYFPITKPLVKQKQEVRIGEKIATTESDLSFGIYYLNPGISIEAHQEKIPLGFSVPFRIELEGQRTSSLELPCSHPSGSKILNR